ncbi:hypothetical protein F4825DRAFT_132622 [Nemania diffusa]|nr:hypothetical protein F4825DRAFT_132622 [Nemania diffusa]
MITRGGRVARGTPGRGGFGGHFTPIRRSKVHVLHFSDHAGKPACMVFRGRETCTLPPLYAIAIYFTHPEADPSAVDPEALFETIIRHTPLESGCFLRLELFFTPPPDAAAEVDACVAHYRREKSSRGDYTRQIHANQEAQSREEEEKDGAEVARDAQSLPGLVPSYIDDPNVDWYHGFLYVCPHKDWRSGDQPFRRVLFDPIEQERYADLTRDCGQAEVLAPTLVRWEALRSDSGSGVGSRIFEMSNLKMSNDTTEPWQEAVERGWISW